MHVILASLATALIMPIRQPVMPRASSLHMAQFGMAPSAPPPSSSEFGMAPSAPATPTTLAANPIATFSTTMGTIRCELLLDEIIMANSKEARALNRELRELHKDGILEKIYERQEQDKKKAADQAKKDKEMTAFTEKKD